ncbi:VWD domain-containing protein [Limnoraphis robusta Tam1]|uniref:VWD domain-containing protein n=1 Tax=Limnoraphis robusta TaxID=1118279 RepID=UPI002B213ED5|nr:VWD domain-containing protein [Limnoraphis robusta]MEA5542097.1 VWD domain-containing protein [Limnoraphis robusta Tam1]
MKTLNTLETTETTTVQQALQIANNSLSLFATSPDFQAKMQLAFGDDKIWEKADLIDFPTIEIRPAAEINNARGAFAAATNTIYLSQELVNENSGNVGAIASVLLEEYGHYIDAQNNAIDSPGDEGELFASLVLGKALSESELLALWGEDDSAIVVWDGEGVSIEQAELRVEQDILEFYANEIAKNSIPAIERRNLLPNLPNFELKESGSVTELIQFDANIDASAKIVPYAEELKLGKPMFEYPISMAVALPTQVSKNETFSIGTIPGYSLEGEPSIKAFGLELGKVDIVLESSVGQSGIKNISYTNPFNGRLGFAEDIVIPPFKDERTILSISQGDIKTNVDLITNPDPRFGDPILSGDIKLPNSFDPKATEIKVFSENGAKLPSIKGTLRTDNFVELEADIDELIALRFPFTNPFFGLNKEFKFEPFGGEGPRIGAKFGYDLFDVKVDMGFGLQQDTTFTPDPIAPVIVTMSIDGQPEQTGILGEDNFIFKAPEEGCGVLKVKAKYELQGQVKNELGTVPQLFGKIDGLKYGASLIIGGKLFGKDVSFNKEFSGRLIPKELNVKLPITVPPNGFPFTEPYSLIGPDGVIKLDPISTSQIDGIERDDNNPQQTDATQNLIIEKEYEIPYNLPITLSQARVIEGTGGTTNAVFTVSQREISNEAVSLTIEYANETARAGEDYFPNQRTLTIPAGQDTAEIIVPIIGDTAVESTETFTLTLKDPSGKLFAECEGVDSVTASGIITDDDDEPKPPEPNKNPREFNDPRYITIDGKSLDFQAAGEFTVLESLNDDYKIQIRQQPVGNDPLNNASDATAVATILGGKRVGLYKDGQQLLIDGVPTTIPDNEYIFVGEGRIYREGNEYSFVYPKGDQLIATMTENRINVSLFLSPERRDTVRGIFGTYNDNPDDDILKRDGTVLTEPISVEQLYGEYADSWRVSQTESLFDYQPGEDTNTFTISNYPREKVKLSDLDPADVQKAEELIGDRITDPIIRETAIIDLVLTDFDPEVIEAAINVPSPESSVIIRVEPQATADFTSTFANTPVKINPLSNDIVTTGIPLSLTGYDQTTAKGGTIQLDNNGTPDDKTDDQLTYTPPTNFVGVDTINYTIADDQKTATGTITVTVPAINLTDLNGNNGFTVTGAAGNFAGSSVSNIGDFNGDTIDDFIVGGFAADPNNINATGESYVVFGTNQGFPANFDLSTLNGTNGFIIEGFEAESFSGGAVSSAGDINGDGLKDVMIGAFASDSNNLNDSGRTYIIFGSNQPFSTRFNLANINSNNGLVINSNQPLDYSGLAVSSAGDFNNDGLDDLAVAAPAGVDTFLGKVYVVYGRRTPFRPAFNPTDLKDEKGTIINHNNGLAGTTVSNAGDINGDGIDDLIIGAEQGLLEGNPKAGETYVLFGKDGGYPNGFSLSNLNGSNGFTIKGDGYSVSSVSGAGDINSDGLEDILIGVSQSPGNNQINAGKAYVLFGTEARFPKEFDLFTLNGNNGFVVNGVEADELLGGSVKAAGDVNGDQIDDIIIGASGATANGIQGAGKTYIIFGSNQGFPASLNSSELNGENGFFLNGTAENELSGVAVSSAGDINKDNVNDILIGAPGSLFDNTEGKTYVVFGSSSFGNQPQV